MSEQAEKRRRALLTLVAIVAVLMSVGGMLFVWASATPRESAAYAVIHDFGIACLVSAFVTVSYEVYTRVRFDLERVEAILEAIYGGGVPLSVWRNIKATLLTRNKYRRNMVIRIGVEHDDRLASNEVILDVTMQYDLVNLHEDRRTEVIAHRLDEHIANEKARLPRFVEATIGDRVEDIDAAHNWASSDKAMTVSGGRFTAHVDLEPASEGVGVPVNLRRLEIRTCPGSYYIVTSEIIENVRVHLDHYQAAVDVFVTIRPSKEDVSLRRHHVVDMRGPLLPGHCIEFKLAPAGVIPGV